MTEKYAKSVSFESKPDSSARLFTIPAVSDLSDTYFVRLALTNDKGETVSNNFYWLPKQADVLDFARSTGFLTPTKFFGSVQGLNGLGKTKVESQVVVDSNDNETTARVTVKNLGETLAFGVEVRLLSVGNSGGWEEILPVRWSDNYLALMPHETRTLEARVHTRDWNRKGLTALTRGWNLEPQTASADGRTKHSEGAN